MWLESIRVNNIQRINTNDIQWITLETFMSEAPIEAPASLTEMMDSEGAASLFGSMFN